MQPNKKTKIDENLIEEYYWNGQYIVYINNKRTSESFFEAKNRLNKKDFSNYPIQKGLN